MRFRRNVGVRWSWVAVAALLFAIVSGAQPVRGIDGWIGVCTSGGDDAPPAPAALHLFGHCSLCSLHGGMSALPPDAGFALALFVPLAFAVPRGGFAAWRAVSAWRHAQPRGPPSRG